MDSQCLRSLMLNQTLEPVKSMDWSEVPVTRIGGGGGGGGHFHSEVIGMLVIFFRV